MKKLIYADALKAWIEGYAGAAEVIDGTNMIPADSIMQRIDEMPDAGCAREGSSVSQYCPIAEEAGREAEARVAELEYDRVRLDASLVSAFQDGQGSIWPKLEAAEARIRELEAAAKPEGEES